MRGEMRLLYKGARMSSIKKIGINRYLIKVIARVPGVDYPVTKQETFQGNRLAAEARKVELIAMVQAGKKKSSLTLKDFNEALNLYQEKKGPFAHSYTIKVQFTGAVFGHLPLDRVPDALEEWLKSYSTEDSRFGRKRSNGSVNMIISVVKATFKLLVGLKFLKEQPITIYRFPMGKVKPRDRYLTPEELGRLLTAISEHRPFLYPVVNYMRQTPCRIMELLEASRDQFNIFTKTVFVPDSKTDVPIHKPCPPDMLEYFLAIPKECPWLFYWVDVEGKYHKILYGKATKAWRYCLKKAQLSNVQFKDCRHWSITDLIENDNNAHKVADVAGWNSTAMLKNYRHVNSLKSAKSIKFKPASDKSTTEENLPDVASAQ